MSRTNKSVLNSLIIKKSDLELNQALCGTIIMLTVQRFIIENKFRKKNSAVAEYYIGNYFPHGNIFFFKCLSFNEKWQEEIFYFYVKV